MRQNSIEEAWAGTVGAARSTISRSVTFPTPSARKGRAAEENRPAAEDAATRYIIWCNNHAYDERLRRIIDPGNQRSSMRH